MSLIKLKCGQMSAEIDTLRGANCISLRDNILGLKILHEPQEDITDTPFFYGVPILFPVNRISGGRFVFEGREYKFPINEVGTGCHLHGVLHEMPFEVKDCDEKSAAFVYRATREKPYLMFPHEFAVERRYSVDDNGLTLQTSVTNLSKENMPLLLGFHTSFSLPFCNDGDIEDIRVQADGLYAYERDENYLPTGKIIKDSELLDELNEGEYNPAGKKVSIHFKARNEGIMSLYDISQNIRIVYQVDEKYKYRLIFGDSDAGFICFEPYTCLANCPNVPMSLQQDNGFTYLSPLETRIFKSRIFVEKGNKQ